MDSGRTIHIITCFKLPFLRPSDKLNTIELKPGQEGLSTPYFNCWFARDVTAAMLVGGQEQKHFSPLGTKLNFHVNSSRKYSFVLTPNMAALSRGCKPRIPQVNSTLMCSNKPITPGPMLNTL